MNKQTKKSNAVKNQKLNWKGLDNHTQITSLPVWPGSA